MIDKTILLRERIGTMERVVINGNKKEYYLDNRLLLTITDLGDNYYITENGFHRLEGYCETLDEYRTKCRLDKNYIVGKNGRLYSSKKLLGHNTSWFAYILKEKGFLSK